MKPRDYAVTEMQIETNREARSAALAGTRQMIADDSFSALVSALVDAGAVPREIMAGTIQRLADGLISKARGEMESDFAIYPAEIFDRARDLSAHAAMLRSACHV